MGHRIAGAEVLIGAAGGQAEGQMWRCFEEGRGRRGGGDFRFEKRRKVRRAESLSQAARGAAESPGAGLRRIRRCTMASKEQDGLATPFEGMKGRD